MMNFKCIRNAATTGRKFILEAAWAPIGVVLLHAFLTIVVGHQRSLDPAFHFLGGAALSYFFLRLLCLMARPLPRAITAILGITMTIGTAITWELFEYLSDRFIQNQVGFAPDIIQDFLLTLFGALFSIGVINTVGSNRREFPRT